MGECNRNHGQSAQNNRDYEYIRISYLLNQLKPDKTSGRYWQDRCHTTHYIKDFKSTFNPRFLEQRSGGFS